MMIGRIYILIFVLMISCLSFGQVDRSELITFKNKYFVELVQQVIKSKHNCNKNSSNHNWYIESQQDGSYLISINRISNLLHTLGNKQLYTTIINNQIVFFITQKENNFFSKKGYFIDLNNYKDSEYVLFEDFSYWLVAKSKKHDFAIKNEKTFKCND